MAESEPTRPSDPSKPPKNGRCIFFALPRELRDYIYKYALYDPDGLHYRHDSHVPTRAKLFKGDATEEFNQPKFASPQLYYETVERELHVKHLHFIQNRPEEQSDTKLFLDFLDFCAPAV